MKKNVEATFFQLNCAKNLYGSTVKLHQVRAHIYRANTGYYSNVTYSASPILQRRVQIDSGIQDFRLTALAWCSVHHRKRQTNRCANYIVHSLPLLTYCFHQWELRSYSGGLVVCTKINSVRLYFRWYRTELYLFLLKIL